MRESQDHPSPWHVLQISDVLDLEFASALAESVPVLAWQPRRTTIPWLQKVSPHVNPAYDGLSIMQFPLLRGFARSPMSLIARTGSSIAAMLRKQTSDPASSPLICTVPYFVSVAERWPGPVVYWLTDLIAAYSSAKGVDIPKLDRRMCHAATLVCPNSERLADYLIEQAGCDPRKIHVVPNATRAANLLPAPPSAPAPLPPDLHDLKRPIAGVIGNLAGNMDWLLLQSIIEQTQDLSWVFVGPTTMAMRDHHQAHARAKVMHHPRARFVGKKPYGELAAYARSFDVAVLPYLRCEPTFSGSSTRFYEHLVACRPMVATHGLDELARKVPLLRLVDTAAQAVDALVDLQSVNFDDGLTDARWQASQQATWQTRAQSIQAELTKRWQPGAALLSAQLQASASL